MKNAQSHREKKKHVANTHGVSALQHMLQRALTLHQTGRLRDAEGLYGQILATDPDHPEALHYFGILAHQMGKNGIAVELISRALVLNPDFVGAHNNLGLVLQIQGKLDEAEACYRRALTLKPDFAEAYNNLGNVFHAKRKPDEAETSYRMAVTFKPDYVEAHSNLGIELQAQGKLKEAEVCYRRALTLKPDHVDSHNNLGTVFYSQGRLEEAIACYRQALILRPDFAEVYNNLGSVFRSQGKLDEAIDSYRQALNLKPNYAEAYRNIGLALVNLGRLDEAVKHMQIAVKNAPWDSRSVDEFIFLLNSYMPNTEMDCQYIKAQNELRQVSKEYTDTTRIDDKIVQKLFQKCCSILAMHKLNIHTTMTQLYRGKLGSFNCNRHMTVFNTFNIIPEYCFGCFKVTFGPRTVMELFKLLFLFDKIQLPSDNPRKCMVEIRQKISGTYKGFIYCRDLNEGKEILNIVKPLVDEAIGEGIPAYVKRGCSEFNAAYPGYGDITDNKIEHVSYNEEWRSHEEHADKNMGTQPFENHNNFTNNHSGFTLLDTLAMRNWLTYAKKIGDLSYRKIAESISASIYVFYLFWEYCSIDFDLFDYIL